MPPLQERASGGVLLLDPLRPGVDRDRPRLQGLRHLAGQVDVKHAVLQRSAGHPDVVGKLEPPLERPAGNAAMEIGHAFVLLLRLAADDKGVRSEEHTSELQSLMRISYAVFCLK